MEIAHLKSNLLHRNGIENRSIVFLTQERSFGSQFLQPSCSNDWVFIISRSSIIIVSSVIITVIQYYPINKHSMGIRLTGWAIVD